MCRGGVCLHDAQVALDAPAGDTPLVDAPAIDAPLVDAPADAAASCPGTYTAITGQTSMYRTVTTGQTWLAAETDCENDGVGTHLAVVDNATEHAAVDALTGASIWFGLTDRRVEGTPRWVTGALPTYTNYGPATNTAGYDCAGIYQGKWAWGDCATVIPYVCECDGVPAQASAY